MLSLQFGAVVVQDRRSCYWASPDAYAHVAMQEQRRVELVWIGDEVKDFEQIKLKAAEQQKTVLEKIKQILKGS